VNLIRVCNIDEEGRFGGPERRITQVAKELKRLGVSTCIVLPFMDCEVFLKYIINNNINHQQIDITRLSKEKYILLRYCIRFFWEIFLIYNYIKKEKFDIIHINGSYQVKGSIAGFLAGIPVVWHLNDTKTHGLIKLIFPWVARLVSKGFIVAGQRVHEYYLKGTSLTERPHEEIHAPVDVTVFRPLKNRGDFSCESFPRIVTISGLNPTKGLEYFLRAAIKIHLLYPNVQFIVAGSELNSHKKYANVLKKIISDAKIPQNTIKFLGLVEDVPTLLNSADICVFTSISEASPTSIWEALAAGVPVVTTDVGSVNQFIRDGVSGFVVPVSDTESIVSRIEILLNDAELRRHFSRNGRAIAVQQLDISTAARKHLRIYNRILGNTL
jgi:glycosyltransferase involved in cell wall biosynthesis